MANKRPLLLLTVLMLPVPGFAQPLPPSAPQPHMVTSTNNAASGRVSVANAHGDCITMETRQLVDYADASYAMLNAPTGAFSRQLANGTTLTINDITPPGEYALQDGSRIYLDRTGYPRAVTIFAPPNRCLYFSIDSRSRVGVLVLPDGDVPPSRDSIQALFISNIGKSSLSAVRPDSSNRLVVYEYPLGWYSRAFVPVPTGIPRRARIVWIAYGGDFGNESQRHPIAVPKGRFMPGRTAAQRGPEATPVTRPLLASTMRVIGTAIVDMPSGVVIRTDNSPD